MIFQPERNPAPKNDPSPNWSLTRSVNSIACLAVSMRLSTRTPWPIGAWIVFCAFCNAAGWLLSAFHQLNRGGYAVMFLLGLAALVILRRKLLPSAVAADVRRRIPGDNQSLVRLLTSA